jgi:hypothetical protein
LNFNQAGNGQYNLVQKYNASLGTAVSVNKSKFILFPGILVYTSHQPVALKIVLLVIYDVAGN